jgi:hypothetical protein
MTTNIIDQQVLNLVSPKIRNDVFELVRGMYKNDDGTPVLLTPLQCCIFAIIAMKLHPRVHCMIFTRYGKSFVVALAVLTRVSTYPEKWAIVAGTKDKAKIIMSYINSHIFDSEYTASKFRMERGDSAEAIRRNRNKNHISFDVGNNLLGEVFVCSAQEAIGHGASNIIEDESSLIPNDEHSLVMRMLGDNPHKNFLFKIGNPFERNHFLDSYNDPKYLKLVIDCYQGIEEGRMNQATIDENKPYSFFGVLYECKFPSAESVDAKGWSYLLTEEDIKRATGRWGTFEHYGRKRLGNDVARGGRNFNVWALRGENYATILKKDHNNDLMSVAGQTQSFMSEHHIAEEDVSLDDVGVGGGAVDRLKEAGYTVNAVKEGAKATEMTLKWNPKTKKEELMSEYANMKAQLYAGKNGLANWIKRVGALDPEVDWSELLKIRYKKNGQGLTMIESKDDMRKRGEESPDVADALMLTFFNGEEVKRGEFKAPDPAQILSQGSGLW